MLVLDIMILKINCQKQIFNCQ